MTIPTSYFNTIRRDQSLIGYWRLNDPLNRALDYASKYNLKGFYNGSPKQGVPLIYSDIGASSRLFGETGQNVEMPDAAPLRLTEEIGIEIWCVAYEAAITGSIINKMNSAYTFPNPYSLSLESNKVVFSVGEGASVTTKVTAPTALPQGSAYHIVGSIFRNKMSIMINGVEVISKTTSGVPTDGGQPIFIGALGNNTLRSKLLLGEFALYKNGFSPSKALRHYQIGRQVLSEPFRLTTFDPPSYS